MDAALDLEHHRHIVLVVGRAGDVLVETLLQAGFDAIAVMSESATWALLESGSEPCALVIDTDAPDADAWALSQRVRARSGAKRPAAVLLSAERLAAETSARTRTWSRRSPCPRRRAGVYLGDSLSKFMGHLQGVHAQEHHGHLVDGPPRAIRRGLLMRRRVPPEGRPPPRPLIHA